MTLQKKFFLVVSMLGLALLGSLGAVWLAFGLLQRELATPFSQTTALLDTLRGIKRQTEDHSRLFYAAGVDPARKTEAVPPPAGPGVRAPWGEPRLFQPDEQQITRFRQRAIKINEMVARIDADEDMTARIGMATWPNVKTRLHDAEVFGEQWFTGRDVRGQTYGADTCFAIHELIERTEEKLLGSAQSAVQHGDTVRAQLWKWLVSVFAAGLLGAILAVTLLRRWVHKPVRALREAAARIAEGDLQHRVPVAQRDELGLLSAEVNHMAQMVQVMQDERVDRERLAAVGEVMRRVVHNVRNPLAGIRGLAEVTRLDFEKNTPNRENMDLIVSTVDAFERWLSELLDATSPAAIHPRPTPVPMWIAGIVEIHRSQAVARNVLVHLNAEAAPEMATFDPKHMDHALSALVSNAIEATPAGGDVWITARRTTDTAARELWEVGVVDRGPGISPEVLPHLFEPHFTTKTRGNGLGLAMAQQIVKGHSGRITVENGDAGHPERTGASFVIRLPIHPTMPPDANKDRSWR